jgi:hypothetical protein
VAGDQLSTADAAGQAVRSAARVDRRAFSLRAGVIAAIPVTGALALGTAVGRPGAAVTMAVGAMLSGVAWRAGGGPEQPPVAMMVAAGATLALASLIGTLSGGWPWLHLVLLTIFCLFAGLLSALGRRGGVVGTQSVIAFVVFGRFPEPLGNALALGGLVALGAAMQIGFALLVASPPAWRQQRAALADAYDRLAELARTPRGSSVAAATALDAAERRLTSPAVFGDPAVIALANLVQEGRRIRLSIGVLWRTGERPGGDPAAGAEPAAALAGVASTLAWIAATVRGDGSPAPDLSHDMPDATQDSRGNALLAGLLGQVAAAARMAQRSRGGAGAGHVHPSLGSRRPFAGVPSDLRRLRASATLDSAAGRHAVRLAVVVAFTELLVQRVALPRGYWAVVAAATVLRPEFGATVTRAVERVGGTFAGVVIATLIAVGLQPGGWAITAIVAALAVFTFAVFPANFAAGAAGLTAVIVFLLHAVAPDSAAIAFDRGLDTLIGGAIGLGAYVLWPTWSGTTLPRLLAAVAEAQRDYLDAVLGGLVEGVRVGDERLRALARGARIAYSDAESAVTLAQAEPVRGTDPQQAVTVLGGLRRIVYAVHGLRIEGGAVPPGQARPELAPLRGGLRGSLELIAGRLRGAPPTQALPPLRRLFRGATADQRAAVPSAIRIGLDELVDATNTVASAIGLAVGDHTGRWRAGSETIA